MYIIFLNGYPNKNNLFLYLPSNLKFNSIIQLDTVIKFKIKKSKI